MIMRQIKAIATCPSMQRKIHRTSTPTDSLMIFDLRKIRLIEGNAKNVVIKQIDLTLRQVFYLSEDQNPISPLPYTLYTCIQYAY
jgi:hypothetical protein